MSISYADQGPLSEGPGGSKPAASPPGADARSVPKALPRAQERHEAGRPGDGRGRIDVTGIMPEGIRIDPEITEGHPGYDESGGSEIIPAERLLKGEATPGSAPHDAGG